MAKTKIGKSVEDIFAPTSSNVQKEAEQASIATKRGRPNVHIDQWSKVTTVLFNRQIAWLDHLAADIRIQTGAALTRAELIRAILSSVEDSGLDLRNATSEKEITAILSNNFRNK